MNNNNQPEHTEYPERREGWQAQAKDLTHRLDRIEDLLKETSDVLLKHVAAEEQIKPALDELITLWRGSKIILPLIVSLAVGAAALVSWIKEHIRW